MVKRRRAWSTRAKILATLFVGFLVMSVAFVLISYTEFKAYTISDCINYAYGLNSLIADELDIDHIEDYIAQGHGYPGYDDIERHLYKLRDAYPDIVYLYVYQIHEDGCHVVFDLDTDEVPATEPGEVVPFDALYEKYIPDLLAGREIPPVISNDFYGYLLTIYTPLYDSQGVCRCYAAVDYSMKLLMDYVSDIIRQIIFLFLFVVLAVVVASVLLTDRGIIRPMKRLEKRAYRDTLTGLLNRTAFYEYNQVLNGQIASGEADFSIIMVDVNFLKRMNDTHGHEKGNKYLKNAADLIDHIFGQERLYRTGGDEFVGVFEGEAQSDVRQKIHDFKNEIVCLQSKPGLQPWQRVSAAVGVTVYDSARDKSAEDVLKRADAAMYQDKLTMKAERKD